ncbi:hypothetical protein BFJ66_g17845, partial [Fusarium oxysporum f. sp. cepae]
MKITALTLLSIGVMSVSAAIIKVTPPPGQDMCFFKKLGVQPWHNCNQYNGGKDPWTDQDCDLACARVGAISDSRYVPEHQGWMINADSN